MLLARSSSKLVATGQPFRIGLVRASSFDAMALPDNGRVMISETIQSSSNESAVSVRIASLGVDSWLGK